MKPLGCLRRPAFVLALLVVYAAAAIGYALLSGGRI